jgi:ectoine hydroxylase-related dioxygenase (phytanoyl-CoA dioxygenase family)
MAADLSFFRDRGYQILRNVIPAETTTALKSFLEGSIDPSLDSVRSTVGFSSRADFVTRVDDVCREGKLESYPREIQMVMTGHFPLQTRLARNLWAVPQQASVRDVLRSALKSENLFMHMPPTARFVLPGSTRAAVPPHRDVSYNSHMRDFVIFWVPLTRIDDECGGVAIYEGSQNKAEDPVGTENFWLKAVSTEGYERVHCTMDVGDALLMHETMLHGSVPNVSGRVRCSVDFRFFGENSTSAKHMLDLQTWQVIEPPATDTH